MTPVECKTENTNVVDDNDNDEEEEKEEEDRRILTWILQSHSLLVIAIVTIINDPCIVELMENK